MSKHTSPKKSILVYKNSWDLYSGSFLKFPLYIIANSKGYDSKSSVHFPCLCVCVCCVHVYVLVEKPEVNVWCLFLFSLFFLPFETGSPTDPAASLIRLEWVTISSRNILSKAFQSWDYRHYVNRPYVGAKN